jgi:hypothetical protein
MSDTTGVNVKGHPPPQRVTQTCLRRLLNSKLIGDWMFGPALRDERVARIAVDPRVGDMFSVAMLAHTPRTARSSSGSMTHATIYMGYGETILPTSPTFRMAIPRPVPVEGCDQPSFTRFEAVVYLDDKESDRPGTRGLRRRTPDQVAADSKFDAIRRRISMSARYSCSVTPRSAS